MKRSEGVLSETERLVHAARSVVAAARALNLSLSAHQADSSFGLFAAQEGNRYWHRMVRAIREGSYPHFAIELSAMAGMVGSFDQRTREFVELDPLSVALTAAQASLVRRATQSGAAGLSDVALSAVLATISDEVAHEDGV